MLDTDCMSLDSWQGMGLWCPSPSAPLGSTQSMPVQGAQGDNYKGEGRKCIFHGYYTNHSSSLLLCLKKKKRNIKTRHSNFSAWKEIVSITKAHCVRFSGTLWLWLPSLTDYTQGKIRNLPKKTIKKVRIGAFLMFFSNYEVILPVCPSALSAKWERKTVNFGSAKSVYKNGLLTVK